MVTREDKVLDWQHTSSSHPQLLKPHNYNYSAICSRTLRVILSDKCQDYLPLIVIWQPRDLRFESDSGRLVWPLRALRAHGGCTVSLYFTVSLLRTCCHLLRSKECCVHAFAFPSQWTHLAFPADRPFGRFWLSKITFSVDYTLYTASLNYSSALRWPAKSHRAVQRATVHEASSVTKRLWANECTAASLPSRYVESGDFLFILCPQNNVIS